MTAASGNIQDIEHERWLDFTYTFGNDGFFEDGLFRAMQNMESISEIFFGKENASAGFATIVRGVFPNHPDRATWLEILEAEFSSIFSDTPVGHLIHSLTAYADFGIFLTPSRDLVQREKLLERQVETAERLLELLPVEKWDLDRERLVTLIRKASARWKVDSGQPITAKELAILSGKALQTIKNKLSGQYKELEGTGNEIEAREAAAWLSAQKDFKTSIWRQQDDRKFVEEMDRGLEKVFFLPVAKDGSVFHPGVTRNGNYLIDDEGRERALTDFDEALSILQKMVFPQWRRPTPEGSWTRVRATDWRRYSDEEVAFLAKRS